MNMNTGEVTNLMKINSMSLGPSVEQAELTRVTPLTQHEYDTMQYHCPYETYVIVDNDCIYVGDILISTGGNHSDRLRYYIGIDTVDSETYYVLYLHIGRKMHEIGRHQDINAAVKHLTDVSQPICSDNIKSNIRAILGKYCTTPEMPFTELMLSCMSILGFRDHPDIQTIIRFQDNYSRICNDTSYNVVAHTIDHVNYLMENVSGVSDRAVFIAYKKLYDTLSYLSNDGAYMSDERLNSIVKHITSLAYTS